MADETSRLYVFPGGRGPGESPARSTPVWFSTRLYRCNRCGNTRLFRGTAVARVSITIAAVRPFQYEVIEYEVDEGEDTVHTVTTCAACGSQEVFVYDVSVDPPAVLETTGSGRRIVHHLLTDIDPLPPLEKDVITGPDGRWYIGCQRAYEELTGKGE